MAPRPFLCMCSFTESCSVSSDVLRCSSEWTYECWRDADVLVVKGERDNKEPTPNTLQLLRFLVNEKQRLRSLMVLSEPIEDVTKAYPFLFSHDAANGVVGGLAVVEQRLKKGMPQSRSSLRRLVFSFALAITPQSVIVSRTACAENPQVLPKGTTWTLPHEIVEQHLYLGNMDHARTIDALQILRIRYRRIERLCRRLSGGSDPNSVVPICGRSALAHSPDLTVAITVPHTRTRMHKRTHAHPHARTHGRTHARTHTYAHAQTRTHARTHARTPTHRQVRAHAHRHTLNTLNAQAGKDIRTHTHARHTRTH
jgi:hypothetical protein